MKKLRKQILSALLLAFTFFIVHDYCIEDKSYSVQDKQYSFVDSKKLTLDIHDDIHTMFEVSLEVVCFLKLPSCDTNSLSSEYIFLSYLIFPLDKPPVI